MKGRNSKKPGVMEKFSQMDAFGRNISLTFKGQSRYKTRFGASVTLLCIVLVLTFAASCILRLFTSATESITHDTIK